VPHRLRLLTRSMSYLRNEKIRKPELKQLPLRDDNVFRHFGFFREAELVITYYTDKSS
jgi:hypothetical protein